MVTAWLTAQEEESTGDFVHRLLSGEGVKGVGGFSLLCGKLRKHKTQSGEGNGSELDPLAIISNRCGSTEDVPWIAGPRNEVYGLSNTSFYDPVVWPKVENGKSLLQSVVQESVALGLGEEDLVAKLFDVLDTDTLPAQNGEGFDEFLLQLKMSIFIPKIGGGEVFRGAPPSKAETIATVKPELPHEPSMTNGHFTPALNNTLGASENMMSDQLKEVERPDPETNGNGNMDGVYGTQRQTILLVDWEGNVSFRERSLWDEDGKPVPRGQGDVKYNFAIEGWHGEGAKDGDYINSHI